MKPSNIIRNRMGELMAKDGKDPNTGLITYYELAILDFLDEEWEKKHTHEIREGMVCNECGR